MNDSIALDYSARTKDIDGRLHVSVSNISKATVNGYYGKEIPGYKELGLIADKIYMLYRAPEELQKGAATFNNLQILSTHIPVNASDPKKEVTVGSTGTDAVFADPYLQNSLVIWDAEAIAVIESEQQAQLSCGYRYKPVMIAGVTPDGIEFDGTMTEIIGNHVALVEVGRAGPDVVVSDAKPLLMEFDMNKQKRLAALTAALVAGLATDAKPDANVLAKALMVALDEAEPEPKKVAEDDDEQGDDESDEDYKKRMAAKKVAEDDEDEDKRKKDEAEGGRKANKEEDAKKEDDKKAMDAAISRAQADTVKRMQAIRQAEKDVHHIVGDIAAMDSAEAVYKYALDSMGVDVKGVHPSAYHAVIKAQSNKPKIAQDSSPAGDFWKSVGIDASTLPAKG
ncbi:MAG: DUF2213 domain-containing protein [Thiobacillus sp.]